MTLDERCFQQFAGLAKNTASSIRVQVHHQGKLKIDQLFGDRYDFYDWASVTKIVFAASLCMEMVDDQLLDLDSPIKEVWKNFPAANASVKSLLTHTAGLPWWKPFYKKVRNWSQMKLQLEKCRPQKQIKSIYSDLDLLALAVYFQMITGKKLENLWKNMRASGELQSAHFIKDSRPPFSAKRYAPTEYCRWQKKIVQAEVHDENARALGGVSTHAGLFGTIDDLSLWGLQLRKAVRGNKSFVTPKTAQLFVKRAVNRKRGDWGLGFMLPSLRGASVGSLWSRRSFGHLGFTGTSLWYEPEQDILAVILSNRVHPSRDNRLISKFRPRFHTWVYRQLVF